MKISIQSILLFIYCIGVAKADDTEDGVTIETEDDSYDTEYQYKSPQPVDESAVYFSEHFDDPEKFDQKWVRSEAKKSGSTDETSKYDGVWSVEPAIKDALKGDLGLALKSKAKHAAISAPLVKPFVFDTKPLIVQYEVLLQDGQECGGAYIKLLNDRPADLKNFHDKSPYSIMFGPDKCGNDHKLHFIFRHKNPKNGSVEEKHCQKPKERLEEVFADKLPHLYTLLLNPDNTFEVQIDQKRVNWGSLLEDFTPAVNPPAEIEDPTDKKPEDWDEREKIPDPNAVKPEDWDEDAPAQIVDESAVMPSGWLENESTHLPDPNAEKPSDWDTEMDGEWEPPLMENPVCADAPGCGTWEPPLINNPAFKGKWRPPLIDNPNYRGKWRPRKIPNPDFFEDKQPFRMNSVQAVGFELWSMSKDILFDNIVITDNHAEAERWAKATFEKKRQKIAKDSAALWGRILKSINYNITGWTAYFIYCSIPVMFYINYLYKCVKEESVVQKLANLTVDYPVLWAVYIIVLSIPVIYVLYLCCKPSASQAQERAEQRREAEKKKTDEPTEDVEDKDEPEEESKITEVSEEKQPEGGDAEEEEEEKEKGEDDEDAEKISNPDTDEEHAANDEQAAAAPIGEGTRKRKVRKD